MATGQAFYDYPLPPELVAQQPLPDRGQSRLLALRRGQEGAEPHGFGDLPGLLPRGAVLVLNNTKVLPRRLLGRGPTGAALEALLIQELAPGRWTALVKRARRLKPGVAVAFGGGQILATPVTRTEEGYWVLDFAQPETLALRLERHGLAPLPPYIRRPAEAPADPALDRAAYQTVYARMEGSIAAPTAGLHFTPAMLERLKAGGIEVLEVTLHVGLGTFAPIKVDDPARHVMHAERCAIGPETAAALLRARAQRRPIIAVGTTTVRTLESWAREEFPAAYHGETRLFIHSPFTFLVTDGILTNFHLPGSTLLMLVSAFHGRERILAAYEQAIAERFRFFSYGDCMLILPA
jgi:S-adenosylmethionine:tRNA ribosyltransferase-isomerase